MVQHLVGSIIQLVVASIATIVFLGMWIIMPNKNNRKDLLAVTTGVTLVLAAQQAYYLTGDNRIQRADGVWIQWEFPLFTTLQGVLLALGAGIFLAMDYHAILMILFKVLIIGAAFEFGFLSGDPVNEAKTHTFWFLIAVGFTICMYILEVAAHKRSKDKLGWVIMIYSVVFVILFGVAWIAGPEFLGTFSEETSYWLYFVANMFLFVGLPILLNFLQGDEDSIISKLKGRYDAHQRSKYCGNESAPLTSGDDAV